MRATADIAVDSDRYTVTLPDGQAVSLDELEFVEATSGRPSPRVPQTLRDQLAVLT